MNRIQELRKEAGFTQKQLADKLGVNTVTISRYETGDRNPKFDKLKKLSELFLVSIDYITGKSDSRLGADDSWDSLSQKINSQDVNYNLRSTNKNTINNQGQNEKIDSEQIDQTNKMINFNGSPDLAAIKNIDDSLRELGNQIDTYYIDPKKWEKAPTFGGHHIIPRDGKISDYFYDDMNKEINLKIKKIIKDSRNDIKNLANEYHLRDTNE